MTNLSFRDVELISAYLDGQLAPKDASNLETRLNADRQLQLLADEMRQSRALLRQLPQRRAPRNFTLSPQKAGLRPPVSRLFPFFRFASAMAGLLLFFSLAANGLNAQISAARMNQPAFEASGMGGAPSIDANLPVGGGADRPMGGGGDGNDDPTPFVALAAPQAVATENARVAPEPEADTPKLAEEPVSQTPAESPPPVPGLVLWGLLALTLAMSTLAWGAQWLADRNFARNKK